MFNYSVHGSIPESNSRTWMAGTDAKGHFELAVESGTTWDLTVSPPLQGRNTDTTLMVERGIPAGTQGLTLRLPPR